MRIEELESLMVRVSAHTTEKESDFLDSARQQFEKKGSLTPRQINWVASIANKYSEENLKEEREWNDSFDNDRRLIARRVAEYYRENPPYFSNYVNLIDQDPEGFVLSKKQWDKFCENKYAKKILKEYEQSPKFTVGQTIQIRSTNKVRRANYNKTVGRVSNKVGFVLQVDALPITRAAKGSRIYKVLLAGEASPIYCHESDLKNKRGKM